eukprot:c4277_g1_i1.p1 GENE.c4277_g1_i1~~c4277_g1_i1.p1  ORF type:complete len:441 (+),score=125.99 c4277_g1_i1:35-1357(+)
MLKASVLCVVAVLLSVVDASPAFVSGIEYKKPDEPRHHPTRNISTSHQLQPDNYDNTMHSVPNFFEYELVYVENSRVLVWHPVSGQWGLYEMARGCGLDCPIIPEKPLRSGFWTDKKFHKLIFLGCHSSTGHGHMLDIEVSTGEYWIWLFDHESPDPFGGAVAHHRRVEMNQNRVVYMGRDELLFFDADTNIYKVYLVQPKLPMYHDEDPIGPFEPLDQGTFALHEQIIYIGDNHVLDYSPTTGLYSVYLYDRGATLSESSFTHVITQGNFTKGLSLTYTGEGQLVALDPATANFKVFNLSSLDPSSPNASNPYYGFGSLISADLCEVESKCGGCLAKAGCGWCATNAHCYRGSPLNGPCVSNCTVWEPYMCPGEPCNTHRDCTLCLNDPFCGWCSDLEACTEGSLAGPLFGSCDFSKIACPTHFADPDVDPSGCVGQIQ